VTQICRDRFADIRRKRHLNPAAAPAAHGQLSCAPIDVIELQGHHFPGAHSESGQHQQDRIVAPPYRALPIDAGEELPGLLGRDRPWDRSHRPAGDNRNGSGQVQCDFSAQAGVLKKGAQRRGHELGSLHVQTPGAALDESHNICSSQIRKAHSSVAESMLKKLSDERDIVDDRSFGQSAVSAQVLFVGSCTALSWDESRRRNLLGWNDSLLTQKRHQLAQRGCVPADGSPSAMSASQILRGMLRVNASGCHPPMLEPLAEACCKHDMPV
jgi:hypothetical protein